MTIRCKKLSKFNKCVWQNMWLRKTCMKNVYSIGPSPKPKTWEQLPKSYWYFICVLAPVLVEVKLVMGAHIGVVLGLSKVDATLDTQPCPPPTLQALRKYHHLSADQIFTIFYKCGKECMPVKMSTGSGFFAQCCFMGQFNRCRFSLPSHRINYNTVLEDMWDSGGPMCYVNLFGGCHHWK